MFLAAALIAVALAVAAGTRFGSPTAPVAGPRRTSISFPASAPPGDFNYAPFTVSPDGTLLAYTTDQPERLVVRPLASYDVRPLAATEGAYDPFFSPDGQWLGFWSFGQIKKVSKETDLQERRVDGCDRASSSLRYRSGWASREAWRMASNSSSSRCK